MNPHTFTTWLSAEVNAARSALLTLYEQLDKMKYVDGPQLEQQYMEQVGHIEETIIKQEIECELLEEKERMILWGIRSLSGEEVAP